MIDIKCKASHLVNDRLPILFSHLDLVVHSPPLPTCQVPMKSSAPSPSATTTTTTKSRKKMRLADETAGELSGDVLAIIFSFLHYGDIMPLRRVCSKWKDAAKETIVPLTRFVVNGVRSYKAMRAMPTALPNLQQISLRYLGHGLKYSDGEDPDEEGWARHTANWTTLDINIISRFSKLRILEIIRHTPLNGRYPVLFNFPLLQKLTISYCSCLKWDLEVLSGLPSLKELNCNNNPHLTGSLSSLRVLKDTLEKVEIIDCRHVGGSFMDLADFQCLKEFDLRETNTSGDIQDIREHHFPALESLLLPKGIHGGYCYEFQNVSDVHEFMYTFYRLLQRTPDLFGESDLLSRAFGWTLSENSPDWYDWERDGERGSFDRLPPPFHLQFVQAGSRRGWSWCAWRGAPSCEINWFDPEPSSEISDYEAYIKELQRIERRISFYRGHHQPPTEVEYRRLCEGLLS